MEMATGAHDLLISDQHKIAYFFYKSKLAYEWHSMNAHRNLVNKYVNGQISDNVKKKLTHTKHA